MSTIQNNKIVTNLWFNNQAEEAARYYVSIFKNSKIGRISYYGDEGKEIHNQKPGSVMLIEFWLENQKFTALNGGPLFKFSEAISLVVNCDNQEEIDRYWENLSADPKSEQCGWVKDKFGVSWQITPTIMPELLSDQNKEKTERVMKAMMQMKKLDIEELRKAFAGSENKLKKPTYA